MSYVKYIAIVIVIVVIAALLLLHPKGGILPVVSGPSNLSIQLTDPATVPPGTQSLLVAYSGVDLHESGMATSAGFVNFTANGIVNLLNLTNVSQTIAVLTTQSNQNFDAIRFDIRSSNITIDNTTYNVIVPTGGVIVKINNSVNSTSSEGILVDLSPSVIQVYTNTNQSTFVMVPSAVAIAISRRAIGGSIGLRVGASAAVHGSLYTAIHQQMPSLSITSETASEIGNVTHIQIVVKNNGNSIVQLNDLILSGFMEAIPSGSSIDTGISPPINTQTITGYSASSSLPCSELDLTSGAFSQSSVTCDTYSINKYYIYVDSGHAGSVIVSISNAPGGGPSIYYKKSSYICDSLQGSLTTNSNQLLLVTLAGASVANEVGSCAGGIYALLSPVPLSTSTTSKLTTSRSTTSKSTTSTTVPQLMIIPRQSLSPDLNSTVIGDLHARLIYGVLSANASLDVAEAKIFSRNFHDQLNFIVQSNGVLELPYELAAASCPAIMAGGGNATAQGCQIGSFGYLLTPGASVSLSFSGTITMPGIGTIVSSTTATQANTPTPTSVVGPRVSGAIITLIPNQTYSIAVHGNSGARASVAVNATGYVTSYNTKMVDVTNVNLGLHNTTKGTTTNEIFAGFIAHTNSTVAYPVYSYGGSYAVALPMLKSYVYNVIGFQINTPGFALLNYSVVSMPSLQCPACATGSTCPDYCIAGTGKLYLLNIKMPPTNYTGILSITENYNSLKIPKVTTTTIK